VSVPRLPELTVKGSELFAAGAAQAAVSTARVAFVGELRAEAHQLARAGAGLEDVAAHEQEGAGGDAIGVRFKPLSESAGTILVAAQVVGARLADIAPTASREWDPSRPAAPAPEQVLVEVRSPDDGRARASVHFGGGPLGPIRVDLELTGNTLELTAHVCNARALSAFRSGEEALRLGLELSGIRLGNVELTLRKKSAQTNETRAKRRNPPHRHEED
jgi:hypothetical protein